MYSCVIRTYLCGVLLKILHKDCFQFLPGISLQVPRKLIKMLVQKFCGLSECISMGDAKVLKKEYFNIEYMKNDLQLKEAWFNQPSDNHVS